MSGFVGHGFMMAPAVARRMAEWMGGAKDEIFERFNLSRFSEGRLKKETFIIGFRRGWARLTYHADARVHRRLKHRLAAPCWCLAGLDLAIVGATREVASH